jgi:hypothetical protein
MKMFFSRRDLRWDRRGGSLQNQELRRNQGVLYKFLRQTAYQPDFGGGTF